MSFEEHSPQEFDRLVRDRDSILDAIAQVDDKETLEALVEMLVLMAIYDGAVVPDERDWLLCVAERACVPIDMAEVEARAKEYEVVVKETMVTKATELASDAAALTKGKLKTLFVRVQTRPGEASSTGTQ
jgi:tellurite resistance protein